MTATPPTRVVADLEPASGVVQAVGRRPADVSRRRGESLTIFVAFAVLYSVIGHWLVVDLHVVATETLDRFNRALMVTADDPSTLAAVGVDYPPLAVLLLVPFAAVPSLTASLAVVPVVSALFAAFTLVTVNTMMRRALVVLPVRLAVLAGLGLNPLVVMYAALGSRDFLWLAFVVAALGALLAWYVTADIRFVMVAAVAFAVGTLAGYGSLVWFAVGLVMVAAVLARLGADGTEIEGTTVGLAAPTVFAVAVWSAFNLVVHAEPWRWVSDNRDVAATGLADQSPVDLARGTADLVVHGAPIALVVLPALLVAGLARRNGFALWLGVMLLVSILVPALATATGLTDSPMQLEGALPILLVSVVGGVWLARSAVQDNTLVATGLALALFASIPWTFSAMQTFRHQGLERAFHDAVTSGESQEGARAVDGSLVGYDAEQQMADYISDHVDATGSILTDDASTYAVILLTGAPDLFLDRVDRSDEAWTAAAQAPADPVHYLLLSTDTARDELSRRYPAAVTGDDPDLRPVFTNQRYVLVSVPDDDRAGEQPPSPLTSPGPPADTTDDPSGATPR
ncbi:hypothetical protein [Nocardioides rubriscoriae]|uniref:hypothetical protein n=1 Tax=Nocardioides rubriscoriae TaxID=642762 RepID=UPI0011E0351B|nr:hypothetical protein [Nocardioides rubriscoriae]